MYHAEKDMPIIIFVQPLATREVFIDAVIYKANSNGEYEVAKEIQTIVNGYEMSNSSSYEYEYLYPENSSISDSEQKIINHDLDVLLKRVDGIISRNTNLNLSDFGFYNY